jgi:hypothetical protein
MSRRRGIHDDMLSEGARTAPEPETAEERSHRLGRKTGAAVILGAVAAAAKLGVLGKTLIWLFAWHGVVNAWRIGAWGGVAVVLLALAALLALRARSED